MVSNLNDAQKLGFVTSSSIAEGLPAAVGAQIFSARALVVPGKVAMSESGEQTFKSWTAGHCDAGLGALEEDYRRSHNRLAIHLSHKRNACWGGICNGTTRTSGVKQRKVLLLELPWARPFRHSTVVRTVASRVLT